MRKTFLTTAIALAAAAAMFLAPVPGSGQDAPKAPPGKGGGKAGGGKAKAGPDPYSPYYQAPATDAQPFTRTPDGKPDMQGYWTSRLNRAIFSIQGKQGAIVDPPDGMLPYKPEAAAKAKDLKDNNMYLETEAHCFLSGVPHTAYQQFGYQIVQTKDYFVTMPEYAHSYRLVAIGDRPHVPSDVKLFMGDGVGHWEGDTLVVETTNHNGLVWLDMEGNFTTPNLRVVERFTMVDLNRVDYEATITDPSIYTRPWKIAGNLGRHPDANYELMEFACHEGNQDLEHYTVSQGGKAQEKGARTQ
jgi:hypothetical protein